MEEHPPDSAVQASWHDDITQLTAGPVGPQASTVPLIAPNVQAGTQEVHTTPVKESQEAVTGIVPASGNAVHQGDNDPVSTQIQQMNIIHEALSASGFLVVAEDNTVDPTASRPVASEMDVAAYQEAPPEIIQVESVEMQVIGHPVQESSEKPEGSSSVDAYSADVSRTSKRVKEQGATGEAVLPRNINVTGCDSPEVSNSEHLPTFHISLKPAKRMSGRTTGKHATKVVRETNNILQTKNALGGSSDPTAAQTNSSLSGATLTGPFTAITVSNMTGSPFKGDEVPFGRTNCGGQGVLQADATVLSARTQNVVNSVTQEAVEKQQLPTVVGPFTATLVRNITGFPETVVVEQTSAGFQNVTQTVCSGARSGAPWNKIQSYAIPVSGGGGVQNVLHMNATCVRGTVVNVIPANAVPSRSEVQNVTMTNASPASGAVQPVVLASATPASCGASGVAATLTGSGVSSEERTKCSACENVGIASLHKLSFNGTGKCRAYQCHICGQMRSTLQSTESDIFQERRNEEPDVHECSICWLDFKDAASLTAHHNVNHQAPSSFQCSYCSGVFTYKYECDMHEQFTHDKVTKLTCVLCSKEFTSQKRLKKHAMKCLREAYPGYTTRAPEKPQENITEAASKWFNIPVNSTTEGPLKCGKCGKMYKNLRNYLRHVQDTCGISTYKCDGCSEEFSTKRKLSEHEKQNKDNMHYTCVCGQKFQSKLRYRAHSRLHEEQKPYKCKFCGKDFVSLGKCLIHQRSHTGEKPYKCKVCGKEYVMMESLKVHERKHRRDFRFFCKYCQMGFVKKYTYQMHELNHEGHRPFSCRVCGKSFSRKSDCSRHELCTHSKGKEAYRFLCSHCGKAFKLKGDMNVHERIHTGEKPHYCVQCQRGFGRAAYFNRHMRNFHGNDEDNSEASSGKEQSATASVIEVTAAVSDDKGVSLPHG